MDAPKKKGRKKKTEVSKKTQQRRQQRERATMSQKQSVKQSVVVNVGDTKRKSTPRKKGGGMPPASYQHNLQPTFIQAPQVDYTPLILALNRTPNAIQPPMPTISERTPLSVGVQTAEQELASSSTFEPVPLEMNRRPRSSFVSNSHLDRRVETQVEEPRAEVDYGFGNQQFIPRPRSESGISELSEDSMGGFTPLTNPRFTPKAPRKSESITSDEGSRLDDDIPSFYLSSIGSIKSDLTSTSSESSRQSSMSSIQPPTRKSSLQDELPLQEPTPSSIGSLLSTSSGSTIPSFNEAERRLRAFREKELKAEEGSVSSKRSSVSTRKSSLASGSVASGSVSTRKSSVASGSVASGSVATRKSSVSSPVKGGGQAEESSVASSTKLGRPTLYSGSSVDSRVKPSYGTALSPSARQEAEIQALKKTFANYKKSNKLDKLKPMEINDLLIRKGNKGRIDTLAKNKLITQKQFEDYYERYGYVSRPMVYFDP